MGSNPILAAIYQWRPKSPARAVVPRAGEFQQKF
jgi:hypothetical protein